MDGATICVQSGTTTELNLADNFRARGIDFTPVVFEDNDKTLAAYDEGRCDGYHHRQVRSGQQPHQVGRS